MAAHNEFGKAGEQMAADWLELHGFQIVCRNWRFRRLEIDIIATETGYFISLK